MRRKVTVLLAAIVLSFCTVNYAYADEQHMDTVNDLFKLYNEAQLEDMNALEQDYKEMLTKLADAEKNVNDAESYNVLIDEAGKWQTQERSRIREEIDAMTVRSQGIRQQMSDEFDGSWEKLVQLEKAYKMNLLKIEQLLEEYDKYFLTGKKIADYETLDELTAEIAELQKVYKTAATVNVLGDVYTVTYPLGKETVITSRFGSRVDPITGASVSFHGGIDLRAATGTDVLSVFNGVVLDTGYTTTGGYYVNIDHGNGVRSFYCHLSQILCEKGQEVSQYDVIALSGNTGTRTTGPHLHFALYINGNSVNPEVLYKR